MTKPKTSPLRVCPGLYRYRGYTIIKSASWWECGPIGGELLRANSLRYMLKLIDHHVAKLFR